MRLSTAGLNLIKQSEGFRSHAYQDAAGIATIGYGHRILPGELYSPGITEPEAAALLVHDVAGAEQAVTRLVKIRLTQTQFDALVDFVFNLGAGRLLASTLLKELNAGHSDLAATEFLKWDRCAGKENVALKARREAEARLFNESEPLVA